MAKGCAIVIANGFANFSCFHAPVVETSQLRVPIKSHAKSTAFIWYFV